MSGARFIFALPVYLAVCLILIAGCTEKSEKIENPHKNFSATEKKIVSKEMLLLFDSIDKNNLDFLGNELSSRKIDFSEQNLQGDTLLVFAAGKGRKEAVQVLLKAGAPVNNYSGQGDTALIRAVSEGRRDVVEILLSAKADVNARGIKSYLGTSSLFLASSIGSIEVIKMLVNAGADVDLANLQGVTPLMDAAYGSLSMVKLLLKYGANPGLRDESGNTAIKIARREEQKEIVKTLKLAKKEFRKKYQKRYQKKYKKK